jgi:hypothetical protein
MSLNPLAPVVDYQSMRNRIFWFTTFAAMAAVWWLRYHIDPLDDLLRRIDFTLEFGGEKIVPVPGGYLIPALAVGLVSRIFCLHAWISNELGIRESFDVDVIIRQLAARVELDLDQLSYEDLAAQRHPVMREAFYRYVSGSQPEIDAQLVEQALDAWSWFWIGIETTMVFAVTGCGLLAGGVYIVGFETIGATILLAALALPAMRRQCRRYAIAQVRAIAADPVRAKAVRDVLARLVGAEPTQRRAA